MDDILKRVTISAQFFESGKIVPLEWHQEHRTLGLYLIEENGNRVFRRYICQCEDEDKGERSYATFVFFMRSLKWFVETKGETGYGENDVDSE